MSTTSNLQPDGTTFPPVTPDPPPPPGYVDPFADDEETEDLDTPDSGNAAWSRGVWATPAEGTAMGTV
jgi:hypothetical protein